jgi:replicative DNA helicase
MSNERKLLSALNTPDRIAAVYEMGLRTEHFEEPFADHVYNFIVDYWRNSQSQSAPTHEAIQTERPGFQLDDEVDEEPWWLAEQLMKQASKNQVQEIVMEAINKVDDDPLAALTSLREASYRATEQVAPRSLRSDMSDVESRRRRYQSRREGGAGAGLPFGLPGLDMMSGGTRPGELTVVGAYSKVGKTMFLLYVAAHLRKIGYTPIVFSLEMPIDEIEDRLDAMLSGVSYDRLSKSMLKPAEWDHYHATQDFWADQPILIEAPPEGERTVGHLTARARHADADFLIIDQLSFMESTKRSWPTEKMRQADILKTLKNDIGRPKLLPCLMAAQFNRESTNRVDGPRLSDFADAAEVERTADLLLGLSRNRDQLLNRLMQLDIMAGRRCADEAWLILWDLIDKTRIEEYEKVRR